VKITPCSNVNMTKGYCVAKPKCKVSKPVKNDSAAEQDYGRNYMQLSYIVTMSMLGVASLYLATRGKSGINLRV